MSAASYWYSEQGFTLGTLMADMNSGGCRIDDGVRDSKIHWDVLSKIDRNFDDDYVRQQAVRVFPHTQFGGFGEFYVQRQTRSSKSEHREYGLTEKSLYQQTHGEFTLSESQAFCSKVKLKLPTFDGCSLTLDFLDWFDTFEDYFDTVNLPDDVKCELVSSKLKGEACVWWNGLQNLCFLEGKNSITSWQRMRELLIEKYLHTSRLTYLYKQKNEDDEKHVNCLLKFPNQSSKQDKGKEVVKLIKADGLSHSKFSTEVPLKSASSKKIRSEADLSGLKGKVDLEIQALGAVNELEPKRVDKPSALLFETFNKDGEPYKQSKANISDDHEVRVEHEAAKATKTLSIGSEARSVSVSINEWLDLGCQTRGLGTMIPKPLVNGLAKKCISQAVRIGKESGHATKVDNAREDQSRRQILCDFELMNDGNVFMNFDPGGKWWSESNQDAMQMQLDFLISYIDFSQSGPKIESLNLKICNLQWRYNLVDNRAQLMLIIASSCSPNASSETISPSAAGQCFQNLGSVLPRTRMPASYTLNFGLKESPCKASQEKLFCLSDARRKTHSILEDTHIVIKRKKTLTKMVSSKRSHNTNKLVTVTEDAGSFQQEADDAIEKTDSTYFLEKLLLNSSCFTKHQLIRYTYLFVVREPQHKTKETKVMIRHVMDTSLLLDNSKTSTCLISGEYLASNSSLTEFATLLFDPGGILFSVRTRSANLGIDMLANVISVRSVNDMLKKCGQNFDVGMKNEIVNKDGFPYGNVEMWHNDQRLRAQYEAGNYIKIEAVHSYIVVCTEASDFHGYSVRSLFKAYQATSDQDLIFQVVMWCIGGHGDLLVIHILRGDGGEKQRTQGELAQTGPSYVGILTKRIADKWKNCNKQQIQKACKFVKETALMIEDLRSQMNMLSCYHFVEQFNNHVLSCLTEMNKQRECLNDSKGAAAQPQGYVDNNYMLLSHLDPREDYLDLDSLDLLKEYIIQRLCPHGACTMSCICYSLRKDRSSDRFWKTDVKQKWGRLIDVVVSWCNLRTYTGFNPTRGRVIPWEGWNNVNKTNTKGKLTMTEQCVVTFSSCLQILYEEGQFKKTLKLFHKMVNGLDPPTDKMMSLVVLNVDPNKFARGQAF